jgi:hypothetical protein
VVLTFFLVFKTAPFLFDLVSTFDALSFNIEFVTPGFSEKELSSFSSSVLFNTLKNLLCGLHGLQKNLFRLSSRIRINGFQMIQDHERQLGLNYFPNLFTHVFYLL